MEKALANFRATVDSYKAIIAGYGLPLETAQLEQAAADVEAAAKPAPAQKASPAEGK
jgi:hypothetical protein